jgi:hypothetical protein
LERADEALKRASETDKPDLRAEYIQMAQRWQSLAKSFEFAESLNTVPKAAG